MSQHKRFRWTDLLGVAGILLLMVSVPATIADGGTGPEVQEFRLPDPRAGDLLELEVIVQWKDEPARVIGPVFTLEHRIPDRDETPFPADFATTVHYHPVNVTIGGVTIRVHERLVDEYYHAGSLRYVRDSGTGMDHQTSRHWTRESLVRAPSDIGASTGARIIHTPDVTSGARATSAELWGRSDHIVFASARTLEHRGITLYATDRGTFAAAVDEMERSFGSLMGSPPSCGGGTWPLPAFYPGHGRLPRDMVDLGDLHVEDCRPDRWNWVRPDHAERVGYHIGYIGPEGRVVEVDVLPRRLVRGDGPTYVVSPISASLDMPLPPLHELDPVVPLVRLGDIEQDTRPLMRHVTLPRLREILLGDASPAPLRRAIEDGAVITDLRWEEHGSESVENRNTSWVRYLVPELDTPGDVTNVTVYHSAWRFLLVDPSGGVWHASLQLSDTADGEMSATHIQSTCPTSGCERLLGQFGPSLEMEVADPFALLATIRAQVESTDHRSRDPDAAVPRGFTFRPHWHGVELHDGMTYWRPALAAVGDRVRYGDPHLGYDAVEPEDPRDVYWWHDDAAPGAVASEGSDGAFSLLNGRPYAQQTWQEADPAITSSVRPVEGAPLVIVMPAGVTPATAGLALVMASLLVRLVSALKAGAHYPVAVWLYAKIPKHKVLTQERRAALMDLIEAEPGITVTEVARRLGYGWGATVHHLATLERNGLVTKLHYGKSLHWYAASAVDARQHVLLAALQHPDQAQILALAEVSARSADELAASTGSSRSQVSRVANRLVRLGLLEKVRDGRTVRFRRPSASLQRESVESEGVVA